MPLRLFLMKKILLLKSPQFLGMWGAFSLITLKYLPSANFLSLLFFSCLTDLLVGIFNSWKKGEFSKLEGLKLTIEKITLYGGFIIVGVIMVNISIGENNLLKYHLVIDVIFVMMILIELISICRNLAEISPKSLFVRIIVIPFMKLLRIKIGALDEEKKLDE